MDFNIPDPLVPLWSTHACLDETNVHVYKGFGRKCMATLRSHDNPASCLSDDESSLDYLLFSSDRANAVLCKCQ